MAIEPCWKRVCHITHNSLLVDTSEDGAGASPLRANLLIKESSLALPCTGPGSGLGALLVIPRVRLVDSLRFRSKRMPSCQARQDSTAPRQGQRLRA